MPALSTSAGARALRTLLAALFFTTCASSEVGSSVFLVGSVGLLRSDKVASCLFDGINYPLFRMRFSYLAFMFKCMFPNLAESRGDIINIIMMHIQDVARLPVHFAPQSDTMVAICVVYILSECAFKCLWNTKVAAVDKIHLASHRKMRQKYTKTMKH